MTEFACALAFAYHGWPLGDILDTPYRILRWAAHHVPKFQARETLRALDLFIVQVSKEPGDYVNDLRNDLNFIAARG